MSEEAVVCTVHDDFGVGGRLVDAHVLIIVWRAPFEHKLVEASDNVHF